MTDFGRRAASADHASRHEDGGADEISVASLSGELADAQPPKAHDLGGAAHGIDTLADLNLKISDADLDDSGGTRTPSAHKSAHQNDGADEISVAGLSGVLADDQDANKIIGVEVDNTDIADNKVLQYKSGTGKLEYETISGVGSLLVDRGDPNAFDWDVGDLTTDGTWNELDCSGIVPAGATAILFQVNLVDDAANSVFYLRKKGNTNSYNYASLGTIVAGVSNRDTNLCFCDTDRKVEYMGTNLAFTTINILIRGWYI